MYSLEMQKTCQKKFNSIWREADVGCVKELLRHLTEYNLSPAPSTYSSQV